MALQVWAGRNSRISHRAAAKLFGFDSFNEEILEITTTRNLRPVDNFILHRVPNLKLHDRYLVGPLEVTTPARTLLDLGAVADIDRVEEALEFALRRNLTSIGALHWELERGGGRGRAGTPILAKLLEVRPRGYSPKKSLLEIDRKMRATPLPPYVHEPEVKTRVGSRWPDFAFLEYTVAVEGDGYDSHGGRRGWLYDRQRDRALEALGWDVIHVTWEDITERADEFIADLYLKLRRKGWNPPIQVTL